MTNYTHMGNPIKKVVDPVKDRPHPDLNSVETIVKYLQGDLVFIAALVDRFGEEFDPSQLKLDLEDGVNAPSPEVFKFWRDRARPFVAMMLNTPGLLDCIAMHLQGIEFNRLVSKEPGAGLTDEELKELAKVAKKVN